MAKCLFFILIPIMFLGCPNNATSNKTLVVGNDPSDCAPAETNLKSLSCIPTDKPYTKKGKSFTQFCQETINNGIYLGPKCLSTITNCIDINTCLSNQQGL